MRLLFDQNISHRILKFLGPKFTQSTTVKDENLTDFSDKKIWDFAKQNSFVIVTLDSDFNDLNSLFGHPPKIIWLRTKNLRTEQIAKILTREDTEIENFIHNPTFGILEIMLS